MIRLAFFFFCPVFGGGHGYEDKDHPGLAGRSGGTYQHAATGTAQSFGSSCRTAAAPRRDYHRRNRRRGCETHGGMRPGSWSEPSAYGTVSCIVSAGAVACGREHGQKKEQKETKRGEGTGIPACSVSFWQQSQPTIWRDSIRRSRATASACISCRRLAKICASTAR
mgnify:CR=1 FL=1